MSEVVLKPSVAGAEQYGSGSVVPAKTAWVSSQYKDGLSRYGDSHVKDKTAARPSYL